MKRLSSTDQDNNELSNIPDPVSDGDAANKAYVDANSGGSGDVVGPGSSIGNTIAIFDDTTGKLLKDSSLVYSEVSGSSKLRNDLGVTIYSGSGADAMLQSGGATLSILDDGTGSLGTYLNNELDMGSHKITSVTDPSSDQDVATKKYVDDNSGGGGDVAGPSSSTDNALARFDSTTGKSLQDSTWTLDDGGILGVISDGLLKVYSAQIGSGGLSMVAGANIQTDNIIEKTSAAGVTIDGVLLKDGGLSANTTGSAATLTTSRTFQTNLASTTAAGFDGSANNSHGVTGNLPVSHGGSGRATATTAYGLIAAGTTATGAQQTISPGTSGQFLKSAGASALASFVTITSSDVGLGNVDNTSDATKNSASAVLMNKELTTPLITGGSSPPSAPSAGKGTIFGVGTGAVRPHWINSSGSDETILTNYTSTSTSTSITSNFTTTSTSAVQATGLSATITAVGGRSYKITAFTNGLYTNAQTLAQMTIWQGTVGSGTKLAQGYGFANSIGGASGGIAMAIVTPSAGSVTFNVGLQAASGTATLEASSSSPAFILVEPI